MYNIKAPHSFDIHKTKKGWDLRMHSCNYPKMFANRWPNFPSGSKVLTLKGVIWNQINHPGYSLRWLIWKLEGLFRAFVPPLVTGLSSHKDWTQTRGHVSKNISFPKNTARTKIELNQYATLYSSLFSVLDYLVVSVGLLYQKLKMYPEYKSPAPQKREKRTSALWGGRIGHRHLLLGIRA